MLRSTVLGEALALPAGARFHRCAFQINPYAYLVRHSKPTPFGSEEAYNDAVVEALGAAGVEVIAVTDHFRVRHSRSLMEAATAAGIVVFPGFEANTEQGIHLLCLFDPGTHLEEVQARIHGCGVYDEREASPLGRLSAQDLLAKCTEWRMQCIAPHATQASGVLEALNGQARAAVWKHDCLVACAIPGTVESLPQSHRDIVCGADPNYRRDRAIAVLNASDVCGPEDAAKPASSCLVKMTRPTLEGLRQAFLDPESRVRLLTDPRPGEHAEFLAIAWESAGLLQGCRLRFNENLNVLIGGRGTGKSTAIESLRYVLDLQAIGPEAQKAHEGVVKHVLGSGTKVSLAVQSYRPDRRVFVIERTVGNPPQVRDGETGDVLPLRPREVMPHVAVFGQNEISELARNPARLTELLRRFTPSDADGEAGYRATKDALDRSRRELLDCEGALARVDEELAALPGIEETLKRYREAGVEDKLRSRSLTVREEGLVAAAREALQPFRKALADLDSASPLDLSGLAEDRLAGLPTAARLAELRGALEEFGRAAAASADLLRSALGAAEKAVQAGSGHVARTKASAQADHERVLRELQREKIDGDDFVKLRAAVERLQPLREQRAKLEVRLEGVGQRRRNELADWEELKRSRLEGLQRVARNLVRKLDGRLRIRVIPAGDRTGLEEAIRAVGGRFTESIALLSEAADLSVASVAAAVREGADALVDRFGLPSAQAQRLAKAGPELAMRVEELDLQPGTEVELNVAREGAPPEWRSLADLSVGQKATAMLYLLLIESDAPLVVDQPEDNLDNRFISEGIVPRIKAEKLRRQFVFASHNANIPVLGDAEMIVGLSAEGSGGDLRVAADPAHMGGIDTPAVREMVEELLEGGKDAFTMRRRKYGF